jgi:hypothetical protein
LSSHPSDIDHYHTLPAVTSGFIKTGYAKLVEFVDAPEEGFDWGESALKALEAWKMPEQGALFKNWDLHQT